MHTLEQRILDTLRLFAAQHMAVTLLELHRYLVREREALAGVTDALGNLMEPVDSEARENIGRVHASLEHLVKAGKVFESRGFYALPEHEGHAYKRWLGYQFGVGRERRIKKFSKGLRFVPFVRGVAIAGSQAFGMQRKESDIDLLVLTEPGWLWLPRTIVTAYFQLLGIRRHGQKISNRVCLNHYIAGPKAMKVGRNWYTALEYAKLRPIFGHAAIAEFQNANTDWITSFFPNAEEVAAPSMRPSLFQKLIEYVLNLTIGKLLERILGNWQAQRIHKDEKHIIVASDELSFHPHSKQDALLTSFSSRV